MNGPLSYPSRFLYTACLALLLSSCSKENSIESEDPADRGEVKIDFQHVVKNAPLNFSDEYLNDWGENYTVSTFKYYIHDIQLIGKDGNAVSLSSDYFLVDEDLPESKQLELSAPEGLYDAIAYTIGVDSARNVSGAQTGALDPTLGMFWTWNSGYVMAKLEGRSPFSSGLNQEFTYHVGGFKSPYITIKRVMLPAPDAQIFLVSKENPITINIQADVNAWFSYHTPVKIAENPAAHSPGELAKKLADNYEGMFSIRKIDIE
ncbi:MAG: hypothetical protein JNL51_05155 [Chitinophagaceae bacterium]|nr:hypothetical protein [Chitinophagaceae bacterium]